MSSQPKRIVIIGGVAAGMKVAARARRLDPDARITVIERGFQVSYGACALPYYVEGLFHDLDEVRQTTNGTLRDEAFFARVKGVEVRSGCEALAIDRERREVTLRTLADGSESRLGYDALVLATGNRPIVPQLPGIGLAGVHPLKSMEDAAAIAGRVRPGSRAVVVGGGLIGLEMAAALRSRLVHVTLLEMQPQVLASALDAELAAQVQRELRRQGVELRLGEALQRLEGEDGEVTRVVTAAGEYPAQLVVLALGVRPETTLARQAGLSLGTTGAIAVDAGLRTSDPQIWAAGDCVENRDLLSGRPCYVPLGSTANKQGRIVADNICGRAASFPGILGTLLVKVFGLNVGRTGMSEAEARQQGLDPVTVIAASPDKAHVYPGAKPILVKLVASRHDRKLLGAQILGPGEVAKRIDSLVTALSFGATIDQLAQLDLGYAPPYSAAMDPLHQAANALRNKLDGLADGIGVLELRQRQAAGNLLLLDTRSPAEHAEMRIPGSTLLPLGQLRERVAELPRDVEIVAVCKIGLRGYEAQRILRDAGLTQVRYLEGGVFGWPFELERG